jgi:hypothetical protein
MPVSKPPKGDDVNGRRNIQCVSSLMHLAEPGPQRQPADMRQAVDQALSCDRHIRCAQRLQCNWLAAELAATLSGR